MSQITGLKLVFNAQEVRQIHLAFGLGLALSSYPSLMKIHPSFDKIITFLLTFVAVFACLYLFAFKLEISNRAGLPNSIDLFFSIAGIVLRNDCCLQGCWHAFSDCCKLFSFLCYVWLDIFPDAKASLNKATWHFWMQTEGVFGVALGVSASMIFLFVLFGALLERARKLFYKTIIAALGHLERLATVLASGLSGIYSGSSIANVVTTGTFTIPLMKKTGLSSEKAGAVEVASSTNGQLTPPVTAAFLIAEFTGVSYFELISTSCYCFLYSTILLSSSRGNKAWLRRFKKS